MSSQKTWQDGDSWQERSADGRLERRRSGYQGRCGIRQAQPMLVGHRHRGDRNWHRLFKVLDVGTCCHFLHTPTAWTKPQSMYNLVCWGKALMCGNSNIGCPWKAPISGLQVPSGRYFRALLMYQYLAGMLMSSCYTQLLLISS